MTNIDPSDSSLPEEFATEEEAAEFWETHSITDFEDYLEPVEFEVAAPRRHFVIEIDEESFNALRLSAEKHSKPVKEIASEILKQNLGLK
jgi:hypothetical protein